MKIAIIADTHIGVRGRLDDIIWALKKIREKIVEDGISYLFVLGDLLHDREILDVKDLCTITDFLIETRDDYGIKTYAFPGNHDMYMRNSWDITTIRPLRQYLNYIDDLKILEIGGRKIHIIPFIHYESEYIEAFKKMQNKIEDKDILFTHIGVKSALWNTCFLLKSWSAVDFEKNKYHKIFSGHFHVPQKVGENAWYVGSPIPFKFDEGDCDHGFIELDLETLEHKFISVWSIGDQSDAAPQFLTLDDESLSGKTPDDIQGNIVRVSMSKEYTNNQMMGMRKNLENLGALKIKFSNFLTKEEKESIEIGQHNIASTSELFKKFIGADKKAKNLNKKILLKINKDIVIEGDRRYE